MVPVALVLAAGVALALRTVPAWHRVFRGWYVSFQGGDAWYHMRLVDHLLQNFPHRPAVDPYLGYPSPPPVAVAPFFDVLVAGMAWLVGLGSPTERQVDVAGALLPAVLGTATILPVYALGARLFDRRSGLMAAALTAIMPGNFLLTSQLGFADHHVLEVLLALLTLLGLSAATHGATDRARRLTLATLAGMALGTYLLTWTSGAFLVGILGAWIVVQRCLDHVHGRVANPAVELTLAVAVALAMVVAFQPPSLPRYRSQLIALVGTLATIATLEALHRVWRVLRWPVRLLPLGALALAGVALAVVLTVRPPVAEVILADVRRLAPGRAEQTVAEVRPLLYMLGQFSLVPLSEEFGSGFYVGVPALAVLVYLVLRHGRPDHGLLLVTSLAFLMSTLGQNRFSYYLAPALALLSGWAWSGALWWGALGCGRGSRLRRIFRVKPAVTVLAIVIVGVLPSLAAAVVQTRHDFGVSPGWHAALTWLRGSTKEPFDDADFYGAPYAGTTPAHRRPAYTVMAWWDYGYEVIRVARRVPVANPTQAGAEMAGRFFTATDEASALAVLAEAAARYVIVDDRLPYLPRGSGGLGGGKFKALALWAKKPPTSYVTTLYQRREDGQFEPVTVFHPDYYRSMAVRLYVFGGRAATPRDSVWIIEYADRRLPAGQRILELLGSRPFPTFEAAIHHLRGVTGTNYKLVGLDPLRTCVPLEPVQRLRLVHETGPRANATGVRIFEVGSR